VVPKWPKPHPRRARVGANEGNEKASGRIIHDGTRVCRTHMSMAVSVKYICLAFPVTLVGGMAGYTVLGISMHYSKGVARYLKQLNLVIREIN